MSRRQLQGLYRNAKIKNLNFIGNQCPIKKTRNKDVALQQFRESSPQEIQKNRKKCEVKEQKIGDMDEEKQVIVNSNEQNMMEDEGASLQVSQFSNIAKNILNSTKILENFRQFDLQVLFEISSNIKQKGGVVQICSIGRFEQTIDNLKKENKKINEELRKIKKNEQLSNLRMLLFSLEFCSNHKQVQNKIYDFGTVNFVNWNQLKKNKYKNPQHYFSHDLTLFQEGARFGLGIDEQIFNLKYFGQHYKDQNIDIRIQNPCDYGFKTQKLTNKAHQMTVSEYRFFQENYHDSEKLKGFKHAKMLKDGQTFFGVNFQPEDNFLNSQIKKSVRNTFLDFHSKNDLLSYLDYEIPGCSSPQLYFKTPGCWTGGHQQNVNMSALNINHGPDQSQWYTLEASYVNRLRQQLKRQYKMDIYQNQGLWYEKLDWFIKNQYPVKKFLQRKDDIVITGPGTLHWVRSHGVALQTSWNLMPKTYPQLKAAFERHKQNKEIQFEKSAVIPLKSLVVKFLNHERITMQKQLRILCAKQLQQWLQQEIIFFQKNNKANFVVKQLNDLQSFCGYCRQQVTIYYFIQQSNLGDMFCLHCLNNNKKFRKIPLETIFLKYPLQDIKFLIDISLNQDKNIKNSQEIKTLCLRQHIGETAKCQNIQKNVFPAKKNKAPLKKKEQQTFQGFAKQWQKIQPILPQLQKMINFVTQNKQQVNMFLKYCGTQGVRKAVETEMEKQNKTKNNKKNQREIELESDSQDEKFKRKRSRNKRRNKVTTLLTKKNLLKNDEKQIEEQKQQADINCQKLNQSKNMQCQQNYVSIEAEIQKGSNKEDEKNCSEKQFQASQQMKQ